MLGITNTIQFSAPTQDLTLVAGTTNLYTGGPGMPEGVLFKRIRNLDDAVACGGLLVLDGAGMRDTHAGTRWVFYVGDTLATAMSAQRLGYLSLPVLANPTFSLASKLKNVASYKYTTADGASPAGALESTRTATGYVLNRAYEDRYAFLPYTTLNLWGIVTTASRGMGSKGTKTASPGGPPQGTYNYCFMASDTPMSVTMTQFLMAHKTAFLNTIEERVRDYYTSAYDMAAANRLRKPTIAAVTAWRDGNLCPIPMHGDHLIFREHAAVGPTFGASLLAPVRVPAPTARGGYSPVEVVPGSGPTSGGNLNPSTPFYIKGVIGRRIGSCTFPALLEPEILLGVVTPTIPAATGAVGAYKVGMLRDAHLLGRLASGAITLADTPSPHANLAEYINSSYMTMRGPIVSNVAEGTTVAEAEETFTAMNAQNASSYANVFTYGEIVGEIENFVVTWDSLAKAHAEA